MTPKKNQRTFHGEPLSPGIAVGRAHRLKTVDIGRLIKEKRAMPGTAAELARLEFSVDKCRDQFAHCMDNATGRYRAEERSIFEALTIIATGHLFAAGIKDKITRRNLTLEFILAEEIAELAERIRSCTHDDQAQPLLTVQDVYYRLLYNIVPAGEHRFVTLTTMSPGSILVADRLTPVEVASIPLNRVAGIIIEETTKTSHASIISMTLGVPVVIDLPGIGSFLDETADLLLDGNTGHVFVNPSAATIKERSRHEKRATAAKKSTAAAADGPIIASQDGLEVRLLCNASSLADVQLAAQRGIAEIGLFRTEMYYLTQPRMPADEAEAAFYRSMLDVQGIEQIVFRLLDIGGDKLPPFLQMDEESNPQLGSRGARFLLAHAELLKKQMRCMLRARHKAKLRLLVPFVAIREDLSGVREILAQVLAELHLPHEAIELGMMVEIPSVALSLEPLLNDIEFVNLGTNDLIQYLFAANRDQNGLEKYNRFTHPVLLRLLLDIVTACARQKKPLIACGAMTAHPVGCCLLAALGADQLSVPPDALVRVRKAIARARLTELRESLPTLLSCASALDVQEKLRRLGL